MRVLVIEDDLRLADHIVGGLRGAGHTVDHVGDGREGLFIAAANDHDAIVLDRTLPNVDGMAIVAAIKASGTGPPILLVSALGTTDDRVEGLRAGASDYLSKPFALEELIARVEVLIRDNQKDANRTRRSKHKCLDLVFELDSRKVYRGGDFIDLSPLEQRLLEYMMRHEGQLLSRNMILEAVWDYRFDPQTNIVDQHISNLRRKIDDPFEAKLIHTVRGYGYRFGVSD